MSTAVLDKLCTERDETRAAALAIAESDGFDPEDKTYVELRQRASDLDARVASLAELIEQQAAADKLDGKLAKAAQQRQQRDDTQQRAAVQTRESWGEAFVRSEQFASYRGRGTSGVFELDAVQTRALPTGIAELVAAGLTGTAYTVDLTPPEAPTPLMDNITQISVSGNSVEYVAWAKVAGGAAKVAEKAAKPSAEWAPTVTSDTLDTIAVYTQLTRQLVEDFAAVRSMIDGELRRDVARAEEADAVAVLAAASGTIPNASSDTLLGAIRVGMGVVQEAGYTPTAVMLNPADWAELDVAILGDTLNGPRVNTSFWGLTPIPASSQPAGTAIVGDFRAAVHHYVRSNIALYISDSHGDTFLHNVFTLLAERRGLTAVVRPQALVEASAA